MKTTIKVTFAKLRNTDVSYLTTYNKLSVNAKKLYNLFTWYSLPQEVNTIEFNIDDVSNNIGITPHEFIAVIEEIKNQEYFMYFNADGSYVFCNSRMVF